MTGVRDHLHAGLLALESKLPNGWSQHMTSVKETEFIAALPGGPLEVSGSVDSISVALGGALWEDLPILSVRDADRVLAACDAIIGGAVSEVSTGRLIKSVVTSLRLSTRGFDETLEDRTVRLPSLSGGKNT